LRGKKSGPPSELFDLPGLSSFEARLEAGVFLLRLLEFLHWDVRPKDLIRVFCQVPQDPGPAVVDLLQVHEPIEESK